MIDDKYAVLVVDDEPHMVEALMEALEVNGYEARGAMSGPDALTVLSRGRIDVLVSDILMPGMNGIDLIKEALALQPILQCIIITAHGDMDTAVEAMRLGAINYLSKPFGYEALAVAVEKGVEKLNLIRTVEEKRNALEEMNRKLEAANKELSKRGDELEKIVEVEIARRREVEKNLKNAKLRQALVLIMTLSLRYWTLATSKTKLDLAEECDGNRTVWTATREKDGYRTRTLDKYLRIDTIPKNPRYYDVRDTGDFVLNYPSTRPHDDLKEELKSKLEELERIRQET